MEPISLIMGLGTAVSGAMSAIGGYQQGRAQTDAANQAAQNRYRDALRMRQYRFEKQTSKDYTPGIFVKKI